MRRVGLAAIVAAALLLAGCTADSDPDDRAAFESDLAVEALDGVVFASGSQVLLDVSQSPEEIAAAAERVRAHFESLDPDHKLTLLLSHTGAANSETEFTIDSVSEFTTNFVQRVSLWAGLMTNGFASVRMNLFGEGSEYGEGVISAKGWYGPAEEPTAGEAYLAILDQLPAAGLSAAGMQVNVELDIWVLGGETAREVPAELFATLEGLVDELDVSYATLSVGEERTSISIGQREDGYGGRVPYSDAEAAAVLAEFDAAGLLNEDLFIVDVFGESTRVFWGEPL